MRLADLCIRPTISVDTKKNVVTAARLMSHHSQDSIVITSRQHNIDRPIGLLRQLDIVSRAVALPVANLLTTEIAHILPEEQCVLDGNSTLKETLNQMALVGVRRAVVVGNSGDALGIVTIDSVLGALLGERRRMMGAQIDQGLKSAKALPF